MISIWVILLPSILFSVTARYNQDERKKTWILYGIFALFYALRREVGTDWQGYLNYFNNINDAAWVEKSGFEPGYLLLCKIFHGMGLSYWVMVFCISLFVAFLFYKATEQQTRNAGIAVLLGLFFFFYPSLESLRQTIALAIFFYSLEYLDEKPLFYWLLNLAGAMFHRTALIAIFFYFFRKHLWVKIASVGVVALFPVLKYVIRWALRFSPMLWEKFVWYTAGGGFSHLLSIKVLECVALLVILYLLQGKKRQETMATSLLEMGCWINILLPIVMDGAYRFGYYTDLGIILAYCDIYDRLEAQKYRRIYIFLLIAYVALRFLRLILANPQLFGLGGIF